MPVLPSGRRVEFSIDRFRAMLNRMSLTEAESTVSMLKTPDELLYVTDVVLYQDDSGEPFFSGHLATEFEAYAIEWNHTDQDALAEWLESPSARHYRAEAIEELRNMVNEVAHPSGAVERMQNLQAALQTA
jgi:hypothetical protein